MRSVRHIVESIRSLIIASQASAGDADDQGVIHGVSPEQLQALAKEYADACRSLNERAAKCARLLRQGRRSAAVALAKTPPGLIDEARYVDFDELGLWLDACETNGLALPDLIDTEEVESVVEETYGVRRAKQALLRLHRRMAIGQAPLRERLRVMRKLCQIDNEHEYWQEDIRVFEEARIEEVAREAMQADKVGDLNLLTELHMELGSTDWLNPPTKKLLRGFDELMAPHRHRQAMQSYRQVASDLHEAHAALDEQECLKHMARWHQVQESSGIQPSAEMAKDVEPIQMWLATMRHAREEDEAFETACIRLERAMDEQTPRDQLEKLAGDILRFDRNMPNVLAARFASCMADLRQRGKRRFALQLIAIVAGIMVIGTGITIGIVRYGHVKELQRWTGQIDPTLAEDTRDLEQAGRLFDLAKEEDRIWRAPEIQSQYAKYLALIAGAESVRDRFNDRMSVYDEVMAEVKPLIADAQGPDVLDEAYASLATADAALDRAEGALDGAEKLATGLTFAAVARVVDGRGRAQQVRAEIARIRKRRIDSAMAELEESYGQVAAPDIDLDELKRRAMECKDVAGKIATMDGLLPSHIDRVNEIKANVETIVRREERKVFQQAQIDKALRDLPTRLQPDELEQALRDFSASFPKDPHASDFAAAADMAKHWRALVACQEMIAEWDGAIRVASADQADGRGQQVTAHLERYVDGPLTEELRVCGEYLQVASRAIDGQKMAGFDANVEPILTDPRVSDLGFIEMTDGTRYYYLLSQAPEVSSLGGTNVYRFNCFLGRRLRRLVTVEVAGVVAGPRPSPQRDFAESALTAATEFDGQGWETFYLELAAEAVADEQMDPILAGLLVTALLKEAASSCPFLESDIRQKVAALEELELDRVAQAWLDPDDERAATERDRVRSLLDELAIDGMIAQTDDDLRVVQERLLKPYHCAGLVLGDSGQIELAPQPQNCTLYVIDGVGDDGVGLLQVGRLSNGELTVVDTEAIGDCPQGTLVLASPAPQELP